eukprot:NODE_105_length_19900_cov_0.306550.p9 type:complete len:202 gc:universal NODE_105_length_19900_cov_0.306550:13307-12702(-)
MLYLPNTSTAFIYRLVIFCLNPSLNVFFANCLSLTISFGLIAANISGLNCTPSYSIAKSCCRVCSGISKYKKFNAIVMINKIEVSLSQCITSKMLASFLFNSNTISPTSYCSLHIISNTSPTSSDLFLFVFTSHKFNKLTITVSVGPFVSLSLSPFARALLSANPKSSSKFSPVCLSMLLLLSSKLCLTCNNDSISPFSRK